MKDAIDQYDCALYFVEDQIVVDDEHPIPQCCEFGIVGNTTGERMGLQRLQAGFDVIEQFRRGACILRSDIRQEICEILFGNREETDGVFT